MNIKKFIENVCNEIKYKPVRKGISDELKNHLEELKEEYILRGEDENTAEEKAVLQMGDSHLIGKELNKVHKPKLDWMLLVLLIFLTAFGFIISFVRASNNMSGVIYSNSTKKFAISLVIGIILSIIVYFMDYTKIKKHSNFIYIVASAITILSLINSINLTNNIIHIRESTMATIAIPLYIISFIGFIESIKGSKMIKIFDKIINIEFVKTIVTSIIALILINQIPSISYMVVLSISYLIILTIKLLNLEKNKKKNLIVLWVTTIIMIIILLGNSFRFNRVITSFYPESDPEGAGFIGMNQKAIISSANVIGKADGLENIEEVLTLFDVEGNHAIISILAHYGWLMTIALIGIVLLTCIKLIMDSKKIKDFYGKMIIIGISSLFILKSIFHIFMNFNFGVQSNFDLPFVSEGGVNLIVNMICMALVLSIYKRKDILQYENNIKKEKVQKE